MFSSEKKSCQFNDLSRQSLTVFISLAMHSIKLKSEIEYYPYFPSFHTIHFNDDNAFEVFQLPFQHQSIFMKEEL